MNDKVHFSTWFCILFHFLTTWYLEFCQYLFINRWLHTTSLKTIETFICIVLIVAIILSFLDLPMLVIYKFMYPLLSSLVLHFIGAPFLMFSFAYTVKDVIMNNCHGVNIPLVHCQNIFACFLRLNFIISKIANNYYDIMRL